MSGYWDILDPFQKDAVAKIESRDGTAIFYDQGTGKTYIGCSAVERNLERFGAGIGCVQLTNLESSWIAGMSRIAGLHITTEWDEFKRLPKPKLFLVHPEAFRNDKLDGAVRRYKWDTAFFDEAHKLKSRGALISRVFKSLRRTPWRFIFTGTPIEKQPQNVWAQMRFVDYTWLGERDIELTYRGHKKTDRVWIGENWSAFDMLFLLPDGWKNYKRKFNEDKRAEFDAALEPYVMRVDRFEAIPDLQRPVFIHETYSLLGEQRRIYEEMEADMLAEISPGNVVVADLKVTQQIRLQQICNGFLPDENGETYTFGEAKMRRFRSLLRSGRIKPPFVVFCRYKHDIVLVQDALLKFGLKRVELLWGATGSAPHDRRRGEKPAATKRRVRAELNKRFQAGELDALVCQTRTGGVGIDLFAAYQNIVYSVGHSYIDWDQMIARTVRRGQKRIAEFFLLYARNTIDSDIYTSLDEKRSVTEVFFDRLKRRRVR